VAEFGVEVDPAEEIEEMPEEPVEEPDDTGMMKEPGDAVPESYRLSEQIDHPFFPVGQLNIEDNPDEEQIAELLRREVDKFISQLERRKPQLAGLLRTRKNGK
jgi:hypothetical protein